MTAVPRLQALARRVDRLRPDWRNPERYFEDRSDIARELHRLAKHMEETQ